MATTKLNTQTKNSPTTINDLLTGPYQPMIHLIDGEARADYDAFFEQCRTAVQPEDAIEEIWLRDFINYAWEINRLQRMKAALIQSARRYAVERILSGYCDPDGEPTTYARAQTISYAWSLGDSDAVEYVNSVLRANDLNIDAIMTKAITSKLKDLERLDKLIDAYTTRRDGALRQMEKRRDQISKRLQALASTDADFEVLPAAE